MANWGWSHKPYWLVKYLNPPINNIPGGSKGVWATPHAFNLRQARQGILGQRKPTRMQFVTQSVTE